MSKDLYDKIYETLENADFPIKFFKYLEKNYTVIVFGGCVRDFLFFRGDVRFRDLDYVICGMENNEKLIDLVNESFEAQEIHVNQFGGVKIVEKDISIDCWRLEDTYAFRKGKIQSIDVEHLLDTPMLNIDKYAYILNTKEYLNECNVHEFPKEIRFNLYIEDILELNLIRALIYSKKYGIKLSKPVREKIKMVYNDETRRKKIYQCQIDHYKTCIIDLDKISQEIEEEYMDD